MIRTIFVILLLSSALHCVSQITNSFAQVAAGYLRFSDDGGFFIEDELSIRTAVGFQLKKNWRVGFKYQQIFYKGSSPNFEFMWLMGPFGRYYIRLNRLNVYLETGFFWGNYCACGQPYQNNYRESGLLYGSFGGGVEYQLKPQLYLEGGIILHEVINRLKESHGYNGYMVGLVFLLQGEDG